MNKQKMPMSKDQVQADKALALKILENEPGVIEDSTHDYQCFTYKSDDVSLVFYPHKTSAGNYHMRVRNQGSKSKIEAKRIMRILDFYAGYNCTFTHKI